MSIRIITVHVDPEGGNLVTLYCRCGQNAIEGRDVMGSTDYVCPDGHGWVGNVRSDSV